MVLGVSLSKMFTHTLNNWWNDLSNDNNKVIVNTVDTSNNKSPQNEVFNISNNLYTYHDAQAVCSSYGAQVATYDQIEDAYKHGGEWCNYGWSQDQMIYFPTQKATWEKLQQNPTTKNNCGRPGINGGYIANPYVRFGVNCYGKKPKPTAAELGDLSANQHRLIPSTPNDVALENKIKFWKDNHDTLMRINSFNNNNWSEY
jgi:hypothetical protein